MSLAADRSAWAKTRALPKGRALQLVRQAATGVYDPDTANAERRRMAMRLDQALVRLITTESRLPQIEAEFSARHEANLGRARNLLGGVDGPDAPTAGEAVSNAVRSLGESLRDCPETESAGIWNLLRDIAATDKAGRQALEQAIAETRDAPHPGAANTPAGTPLDAAALDAYLGTWVWDGPRPKVAGVEALVGGQSKSTFLVDIEPGSGPAGWRDGVVVRMDTGNFDFSVTEEYPLLERLFEAGISVPEPLLLEPRGDVFGQPFLITRRLAGAAPGMLIDTAGATPEAALALAEALGRLHSVPVADLVDSPPADLPEIVEAARANYEQSWRSSSLPPSVAVELGHVWIRENVHKLTAKPCLVHGDAGLHNILLDEGQLTGMLDWEFAHVGDPAEDLAYCRPAVERLVPWEQFMERYRDSGGPEISADRLAFFGVWCQLKNSALAAGVLRDVAAGKINNIDMLVTAIDTHARFEAMLSQHLDALISAGH
ncbi:phosphotransferase family protein [Arthrobacter sp. I2-34]|uniref:Phosphotransferase family protein n=1 Tax=Arthrobacter hankyongi TaxID=2904801 RepID=A0ABS9L3Q8_9MICC|nr:phosphotransferase family protein [Arthrobacter hankyongi]MCG2621293.1 phosphotransferase family protein [Arthrobacter hankyongi]